MRLRGLIFDFDGLLVDTESAIISAWESIHAEDDLVPNRGVLHALVGHVDVAADIWVAYPPLRDRGRLESRFQELARRRCREEPPREGAVALLAAARAAGLHLAVASNSSHRHVEGHLETRGLRRHFDVIVCREDVPRGKPAPDVYQAALAALGLQADEVLAFEDSVPGHEAAAAAGLQVIVVPNPSTAHHAFPHATRLLRSLTEFHLEAFINRSAMLAPNGIETHATQPSSKVVIP